VNRSSCATTPALVLSLTACATVAAGAWNAAEPVNDPGRGRFGGDPTVVCAKGYSRTVRPPYDSAWRRFRVSVFRAYDTPRE
jgi:hypothetical protein